MLDTSVAVDFVRRSTTAYTRLNPQATVYVPVVVLGELFHGAFNAKDINTALSEVEDLASTVKVLVCDLGVSRWFGQLRRELWAKGKPIPDNDIWIAATAVVHGLPIVTNDQHFRELPQLDLVN